MSEYKGIRGWKVQTVSTDPAASIFATGTWSSGGNLNTPRGYLAGAGASADDALAVSGEPTAGSNTGATEVYNGTSWTNTTSVNSARRGLAGTGTVSTAALVFAGYTTGATALTELWNGSTWTEVNDLNTARYGYYGSGTSTSAITDYPVQAESWNGTSWTNVTASSSSSGGRNQAGASNTDALAFGGSSPATTETELWNGSTWTELNDLNTARYAGASFGSTTSALFAQGGAPTSTNITEGWDGTSWATGQNAATSRNYMGSSKGSTGNSTGLSFGGFAPPFSTGATEEWSLTTPPASFQQLNLGQVYYNSTSNAFKVTQQSTPLGTWGGGGNLPAPMYVGTSCGTSNTSGMAMTGFSDPGITYSSAAYQYDGASWTTVASLNTGKNNASSAKNSPITTTLNYAGDGPGTYSATNESWNNTSWTEEADLNVSGNAATGFGVSSTSAGRAGGQSSVTPPAGPHFTGTEIWNGTSWTEVSDLAASRRYAGGVGTVTAALYIGGDTDNPSFPGGRYTARVESWNGTSWTEIADLNTARYSLGTSGTQTSALAFGGGTPANTTATEFWNGTSWTELNDMATARRGGTGNGSSTSALSVAGESPASPPFIAATEEWNAGTTNFTITVS